MGLVKTGGETVTRFLSWVDTKPLLSSDCIRIINTVWGCREIRISMGLKWFHIGEIVTRFLSWVDTKPCYYEQDVES